MWHPTAPAGNLLDALSLNLSLFVLLYYNFFLLLPVTHSNDAEKQLTKLWDVDSSCRYLSNPHGTAEEEKFRKPPRTRLRGSWMRQLILFTGLSLKGYDTSWQRGALCVHSLILLPLPFLFVLCDLSIYYSFTCQAKIFIIVNDFRRPFTEKYKSNGGRERRENQRWQLGKNTKASLHFLFKAGTSWSNCNGPLLETIMRREKVERLRAVDLHADGGLGQLSSFNVVIAESRLLKARRERFKFLKASRSSHSLGSFSYSTGIGRIFDKSVDKLWPVFKVTCRGREREAREEREIPG